MAMPKINSDLANLLTELSCAVSDTEGQKAKFLDNDEFLNGVKKAIPAMEKALADLKDYVEKL